MQSCIERLFQFAIAIDREIPTNPEAVWNKVIDMENQPRTLSGVISVELLNGGEDEDMKAKVGKRYRVTRLMEGGEKFFADWTIVALSRSDEGSSFPKSITFFTNDVLGASSSSTWSVRRGRDEKSCVATISIALIPRRIFVLLNRIFCACALKRAAIDVTSIDLEDFEIAACNLDGEQDVESP